MGPFLSLSNRFPSITDFFFFFFFLICSLSTARSDVDERHRICSREFSCANRQGLGYPFWTRNRTLDRPDYCGHPDFELICSGEFPQIRISSLDYKILNITLDSHTLELARTDYTNNLCPTTPINTSFIQTLFEFPSETHLVTLYYNCPRLPLNGSNPFVGNFNCGEDGGNRIGYYVTKNLSSPLLFELKSFLSSVAGECKKNATIPVFESAIIKVERDKTQESLKDAIDEGFGLRWDANNSVCTDCELSGGACGHIAHSHRFVCYCADGAYELTCGLGEKLSTGNKRNATVIGIAIASAVVAVALLAGVCFLVYRKRKRNVGGYVKSSDFSMHPSSQGTTTSATSVSVTRSTISIPSSKSDLGSAYFGVHVFSYAELEEATGNFSRELGDGGFGVVYYGKLKDGRAVAVKRLYENTLKRMEQFRNEIDILKSLQHPNLVKLYGSTSRHGRELLLVYEYIPNGTLADHLHGNRAESQPLAWPVRLNIAIDTANALAFLHDSGIIHRDVKTNNILLDNSFHVKVADFGLSRLFPTDVTHVSTAPQGTPGYVDPEYHQCYQLTEKSDVYSYGVVLIELISAKEAVDITRHRHDINLSNMAINRIQNQKLNELVDPRLDFEKDFVVRRMVMMVAELAFRCLQQEKELRPLMEEVVETLERIRKEVFGEQQGAEVVDICGKDDVGLLKNNDLPPLSPVQLHSFAFGEGKSTWEGLSNQSHYVKI